MKNEKLLKSISSWADKEYNKLLPIDQVNQGYTLFVDKFSPNRLKNLDGELLIDTIFHIGNKNGLTYWLEFKNDDEFKTITYGSIAGGSSFKYVMFKRNLDNKWVTGNPQNPTILSTEDAIDLGRKLRDSLVAGAKLIENLPEDPSIDDYIDLQNKLEEVLINNMFGLGWVHKYYHMLYPNKIDAFHTVKWQKHALISSNIKPMKEDKLYLLSGQLMKIIKQTKLPTCYAMRAMVELFGQPINYYRIGTGDNGNSYWEDMKSNSYVAIGWSELDDLENYAQNNNMRSDISKKLIELYGYKNNTASTKAGEIVRFYNNIEIGDIVVAVLGEKVYGIGQVSGGYEYVEDRPYAHCKSVDWLRIFEDPIKLPKPSAGKLTSCFPYKDIENIMEIERLIGEEIDEKQDSHKEGISLLPLTGFAAEMEGVLSRKKQIILYGPPGTGKTYNADKGCLELSSRNIYKKSYDKLSDTEKEAIIGDGRNSGTVRICCFHPSYGYEDFIEGIKANSVNGQIAFELEDGIFKNLCIDAAKEPNKKFFLIIDEINRGDISRIFGELIMLIEKGKRGKSLVLPLSKKLFYVPENVYIVGTMNTADRSIAFLDIALRRRFGFLELIPEYSFFKGIVFDGLPLDEWLKGLNKRICENLGKDARNLQIGHSYFLENEKSITGSEKFKRIIKEDIIPLIEEYCYGDYSLMAKILGDGIVDVKNQLVRYELFSAANTSNLINALLYPCPELLAATESDSNDIQVLDEENIDGDDNES
ncbi:AAA family ATPase [Tissierella praeacuta]|uniref:AAA family ATPase n=1 Tax=Tissierella praeacuta TaxID=43131 RepID=UPI003DA67AC9